MNAAGEPDHDRPTAVDCRSAAGAKGCPDRSLSAAGRLAVLDALHAAPVGTLAGRERGQVPGRPDLGPRGRRSFRLGRPVADSRSGRLIASSEFVRGETPVVSLTAVPLGEIRTLRTYRSHLSRWDFEPYGICIRRDWLQRRGFVRCSTATRRCGTPCPPQIAHFSRSENRTRPAARCSIGRWNKSGVTSAI